MIPINNIRAWSNLVPWITQEQIEQDLVISRSLVELFSDNYLKEKLVFRGGTALHKLFLQPQPRYSEDIDLVQRESGPIAEILDHVRACLSFLGTPKVKQKKNNNTLIYKYDSESVTPGPLRLKIEINCREHFSLFGLEEKEFEVKNDWFTGSCKIQTYKLEEMIGTKIRALYQRKKGRDLYDLYKTLMLAKLNIKEVVESYSTYMEFVVDKPPTLKQFRLNLEEKIQNKEFLADTDSLLRPEEEYEPAVAWDLFQKEILDRMT
jgi:predicted nucleotidyltransferase component of viral defense system